ncbi:tetratricopeptide repeat protein [Staphylococcus massiliensis]|uniref:TPR domain protein n=1 Tax=Staphylococcus massiliensis S46 TaxID=1229783 RepID=K9AR42_9STAP|nr:tetratricopeptide repeat protein [Staphylococcus massiliensis]EKU48501.1 hypothetical protein C273_04800 [Staphylococcus massiliensis S46]MCG3400376.1 tetratricopeptide repeat protein [Staphylococcus massiliensis]MCG3412649.1 tetratricopeptide repeat protein [Staphylococcus massiliensis]POA01510.1 hypothetical protein CD133_01585 [Staphylococcus massiliensis CCUG 55927]
MTHHDKVIPMKFDQAFYEKRAKTKSLQHDYSKASYYYHKVLELSPHDFEIKKELAFALTKLKKFNEAEQLFFDQIVTGDKIPESYYELSQINIAQNEPNKAYLFGLNYVFTSDDADYREELEDMFEVTYHEEKKLKLESELFSAQMIFQHLFGQGRLIDARDYMESLEEHVREHRVSRNLLAMCYLYLNEYSVAKEMFERLLSEDSSDVHALCHYTLLLYNTNQREQFKKYVQLLRKIAPINDDESFKLGIVLSFLKQYHASNQLLVPLYKKGKYLSYQMFHALSFNSYFLGNTSKSKYFWEQLREISQVEVGHAPWMIAHSKAFFKDHIEPLLMDDDLARRILGIFLLDQEKGQSIIMTEDIWHVLESMGDYERLYISYLVSDLKLTRLDFIHRGLKLIYDEDRLVNSNQLMLSWIDYAESIIASRKDLSDENAYVAAVVYLFFKAERHQKVTKKDMSEWFQVSTYKLNKMLNILLSI